jgi:flagellar protein FlaJ
LDKAARVSRHFLSLGEFFSNIFPGLEFELEQANFEFESREWIALAFFSFVFYFSMLFGILFIITIAARVVLLKALFISLAVGLVIGMVSFLYLIFYPKLCVNRKVRNIEKNLPYALHHLLIDVRSGVPLFNALSSIAHSDYELLSDEIQKAINDINTGKSEIAALEKLARRNPSLYFRRVIWQIVNALKSGADVGSTISQIVIALLEEQKISIKRYGAQLNPLALMYMIFAVIFPTLGITFILVISSFIGFGFDVEWILMSILGFLLIFQFMIIGLIKSRRPMGI